MQTDPVRILSELPHFSDSPSAPYVIRRYSCLQKNCTDDDNIWEVMSECGQSSSSSDPELRSSRHCVTRDGHNSALSCQHVAKSRQHASLNESLGPSYRSRCQLKENSSASDHSSHSSVCERSEHSRSHYSEAGKASWSNKRQWNQPPMANRSRPETQLSGSGRSGQRNGNCFVSERSRHRSLPDNCPGNFNYPYLGAMSYFSSLRPTMTTSINRSQQYSGPNGNASRSKFRRIESRSPMNLQPRYSQKQAVRPVFNPQLWLPPNSLPSPKSFLCPTSLFSSAFHPHSTMESGATLGTYDAVLRPEASEPFETWDDNSFCWSVRPGTRWAKAVIFSLTVTKTESKNNDFR